MATEAALNLRSLSRVISNIVFEDHFNRAHGPGTYGFLIAWQVAMWRKRPAWMRALPRLPPSDPASWVKFKLVKETFQRGRRLYKRTMAWRRRAIRRLYQRYLDAYAEWLACHIVQYMLWGARACTPLAFVQPPVCCPA